ncbi:hypothetical protein NQ317_003829 [Molorchus minor]|nr:hypothetical protein NQ317_003829 [Molorchus minor]
MQMGTQEATYNKQIYFKFEIDRCLPKKK